MREDGGGGGFVFVPGKGRQKGPLAGWCTVASYAMATSRRQPLKMVLCNRQGTFTQPVGQPSGRLGTAIVLALRAGGWGGEKRGVWERYGRAEEVFCLIGEDKCAGRQKKLCLNRDVASHYDA